MKVLIIGAGMIGAATAFRLGRAGAEVTVLEAAKPAAAASGRSFGWINASFFANPAHHHLRVAAMAAHHRLQADLPDCAPNWQGTLWWEDEGAGFEAMQTELRDLGYPVEPLTRAEVAAAEPALRKPAQPRPALSLREGAVEPAALTRALLAASGAKLLSGIAAKSLLTQGGRVTGARSPIGPFTADHTVLAAGVATPALLHSIGLDLPMLTRPGLLLRTKPVALRLNHILVTPEQEIRQIPDGSLLAPCAANHQADSAETIPDASAARAATLANLRGLFGAVSEAETLLGHRPVPGDTLPGSRCRGQGAEFGRDALRRHPRGPRRRGDLRRDHRPRRRQALEPPISQIVCCALQTRVGWAICPSYRQAARENVRRKAIRAPYVNQTRNIRKTPAERSSTGVQVHSANLVRLSRAGSSARHIPPSRPASLRCGSAGCTSPAGPSATASRS